MIYSTIRNFFRQRQRGWSRLLAFAALAVLPLNALSSVTTEIAWYPSSDPNVTGYNIYYGTNSHAYTQMTAAGDVTNVTIGNLLPDATYYFSVKSHNAAGTEGSFSSETLFASYATTPTSSGLRMKTFPNSLKQDQLVFSLAPGAPTGVRVNPTNGIVCWLPGFAQANTTQSFNVIITDLTNPAASTQQTIVVTVSDFLEAMLASVPVQSGTAGALPLSLMTSDGITNLTINLAWPGGALLNPQLTFGAPVAGGTLQNYGTNLCLKLWTASGNLLTGTNVFAQINFQVAAGETSAFHSVPITSLTANKADGSVFSTVGAKDGEVVVIGTNPLLRSQASSDQGRTLAIYANPGMSYQVQSCTNLTPPINWQPLQNFAPTNMLETVSLDSANPIIFYRLMQN